MKSATSLLGHGIDNKKSRPRLVPKTCICIGLAGLLLGAMAQADVLYVSNVDGNTITAIASDGTASTFATNGLNHPVGLAFDRAGNLYVANNGNNTIEKFAPDGTPTVFANSGLYGPRALAFDGYGNLFVGNEGNNTIMKFAPDGTSTIFANSGSGLSYPEGLAFDGIGNLFEVNLYHPLIEFASSGSSAIFPNSAFGWAGALAFDRSGNLYVANYSGYRANTITRFAPDATDTVFATSGLDHPYGLAFDSSGYLYVGNYGDNTIEKFDSAGRDLGVFASLGLHGPTYMAFAPVTLAPTVQTQPASQVGYWGKDVSFSVNATGAPPLSFQWFANGSAVPWATNSIGGTNSTLTLTNLDLGAAGDYWVVVSNSYGTTNSDQAKLVVNPAGVSLGLYAGVTIDGVVGKTYGVQYTSDLSTTNWTTAVTVTLTNSVQVWVDASINVVTSGKRFYRVVAAP